LECESFLSLFGIPEEQDAFYVLTLENAEGAFRTPKRFACTEIKFRFNLKIYFYDLPIFRQPFASIFDF